MTKAELKYFQSLGQAKYRKEEKKYLVEGTKSVLEWLSHGIYVCQLIATEKWLQEHDSTVRAYKDITITALPHEIDKISTLTTPPSVIVVASMAELLPFEPQEGEWVLALDGIRDPGNMGSIIRIADWYGISHVMLTRDCVEVYNPKVVQSSMGSLLRVQTCVLDSLQEALAATSLPKYITHLEGTDMRELGNLIPGIIVIGNESNGVSQEVYQTATTSIFIPKLGAAESLNAAVATGIVCHSLVLNSNK